MVDCSVKPNQPKDKMNFNLPEFTKDQKEAIVLISVLSFFAIICFASACLLPLKAIVFSFFLAIGGLFLLIVAVVGYFIEFRGWDPKD